MKSLTKLQLKALLLVANFGYLTTRDLALLCWPNQSANASLKAAQKVVTDLLAEGMLVKRPSPVDSRANLYIVTRPAADVLCDHHCGLWFAHGYDLSTNENEGRRPLIQLMHDLMGHHQNLEPVGARGLAKDYRELARYSGFDALLINAEGQPVFGFAAINSYNVNAEIRVRKLAKFPFPLLIATMKDDAKLSGRRLDALTRCRARSNPTMEETLAMLLPVGLVA